MVLQNFNLDDRICDFGRNARYLFFITRKIKPPRFTASTFPVTFLPDSSAFIRSRFNAWFSLSPELFSFLIILVVFGAFPAPSSPGTSFSALFSSSVSSENANARVLFDDDDDADEEADVELQTLLFASEEDHDLLALALVAETAIAFPAPRLCRPLWRQSVEERPRDDDMTTRSVLLRDAAVACGDFLRFFVSSFIQNPKKQCIVHFLLKKSRI